MIDRTFCERCGQPAHWDNVLGHVHTETHDIACDHLTTCMECDEILEYVQGEWLHTGTRRSDGRDNLGVGRHHYPDPSCPDIVRPFPSNPTAWELTQLVADFNTGSDPDDNPEYFRGQVELLYAYTYMGQTDNFDPDLWRERVEDALRASIADQPIS